MKALLIIDMQYDFLPGGSLAVAGGDSIIPAINNLQKNYELIVATQDWHPSDHTSFASQHTGSQVFDTIQLNGLPQTLWPDHCVQNTPGAELTKRLNTNRVEAIFRKGMDRNIDSYSAFFDNGHLKATGLAPYLKGRDVDEVHICGLAADYCVYYSAKDALVHGFKTAIIEYATKAIDVKKFNKLKQQFIDDGGALIT